MFKRVVDNGQSYYALWWVARTTSIGCIVLFLTNLSSITIIWMLLPLKEIRPMLFTTQEKTNQVVKIEPLEKGTKGMDLLMDTLARQYVELRETLDFQTESTRWQKVYWFSSQELAESFQKQMDPQSSNSPFKQFKDRNVTRSVNVKSSISLAPSAPEVWQVDWESVDRDLRNGTETRGHWISTLTAECLEREVSLEDQYINPLGFTITHYLVSSKQPSMRNLP